MRPIPAKLRKRLANSHFMQRCALHDGKYGACTGKIEWHHVWIYAGKQINEDWAIVPACEGHHAKVNGDQEIRKAFERISLDRTSPQNLEKYPKKDWKQIIKYLRQK